MTHWPSVVPQENSGKQLITQNCAIVVRAVALKATASPIAINKTHAMLIIRFLILGLNVTIRLLLD